jgi:peptide/nickel transport system permease protein
MRLTWQRFKQRKIALFGLVVFAVVILLGTLAPVVAPYPSQEGDPLASLYPPSLKHPLGTDNLGRDILSEIIWGARTSMIIALSVIAASTAIGILIGAMAGYFGGKFDLILSRLIDMFLVMPRMLLAILLVAMFGSTLWNIVLALTVAFWPVTARLVRAEYLSLRSRQFVEAARMAGLGHLGIIFSEILPSVFPVIIVNCTFLMSQAIISEAGLSFLGLNDPNVSSWGKMVFTSTHHLRHGWWTAFFPGMVILFTALSLNLAGDGLNEVINPKISRVMRRGKPKSDN